VSIGGWLWIAVDQWVYEVLGTGWLAVDFAAAVSRTPLERRDSASSVIPENYSCVSPLLRLERVGDEDPRRGDNDGTQGISQRRIATILNIRE
jgi:hypothetical protein